MGFSIFLFRPAGAWPGKTFTRFTQKVPILYLIDPCQVKGPCPLKKCPDYIVPCPKDIVYPMYGIGPTT